MKNNSLIDDVVAKLDQTFEKGTGHVNITVQEKSIMLEKIDRDEENLVKVTEKLEPTSCDEQRGACKSPTLLQGLDNEREEEQCVTEIIKLII